MQRLILMRHAKAEASAPGGDVDRALSERGRRDAAAMGRALAERGLKPDMALVSGARRTRDTWDAVSEFFGDVDLRVADALYNASADTLRRAVEAAEDEAGCLLLIAHNPGVHQLAVDYLIESAASPSVLDKLSGGFPTAAAAVFRVDVAGRPSYEGWLTPEALQA
ncbi:histidine phosphatase family protein [Brevundimonas naejangsanensis]|uniref:Histidine phosphatase family protein n=1 Tax=Brevundimonas naejangsanensis TaxID=588932 RepID=A0A494RFE8_9CAUL|nr:histidine phosphatase family protein [Brevundimonas naejangsanensis]AYG95127.1 histidine phosphatase family protein [Brevundimonas naejangsanensis]